ncbi:MAG: ribonuclease HI family protein [Candidatus Micrarchaeaceae archaeon]
MIFNIYTDGASRNNPGNSASGYRIFDEDGNLLASNSIYNGVKTNNEAEYLAIIMALQSAAHEFGHGIALSIYSDSQLVVSQLKGSYKVKSRELKKLHEEALSLLKKFNSYSITNVPRETPRIAEVDAELNLLLDRHEKGI